MLGAPVRWGWRTRVTVGLSGSAARGGRTAVRMGSQPDFDEVQGNVTPGFRKDFQELLFVRFPTAETGKAWARALRREIASAREVATYNQLYRLIRARSRDEYGQPTWANRRFIQSTWVNVAFSWAGLEVLRHTEEQATIPDEFKYGMFRRAEQVLNDTRSEIDAWELVDSDEVQSERPEPRLGAHALLIVGADTAEALQAEVNEQLERISDLGVKPHQQYHGETLGTGRDHFGFRDGISQPDPDNPLSGWDWQSSEQIVAPGEFILGAENQSGRQPSEPEWMRNGSYLAFRRLRMWEDKLHATVQSAVDELRRKGVMDVDGPALKAKLLGRWPSGAVISPPGGPWATADPVPPDGEAEPWMTQLSRRDFERDPYGDGCPVFSHVRKSNPRHIEPDPGSPNAHIDKHRLIRRGVPFGRNGEKGLLFLGYQANLREQFEQLQSLWFWSPQSSETLRRVETEAQSNGAVAAARLTGLYDAPGSDPVAGTAGKDRQRSVFYHRPGKKPGAPDDDRTDFVELTLQQFVTVTGGGYFFAPAISELDRF